MACRSFKGFCNVNLLESGWQAVPVVTPPGEGSQAVVKVWSEKAKAGADSETKDGIMLYT